MLVSSVTADGRRKQRFDRRHLLVFWILHSLLYNISRYLHTYGTWMRSWVATLFNQISQFVLAVPWALFKVVYLCLRVSFGLFLFPFFLPFPSNLTSQVPGKHSVTCVLFPWTQCVSTVLRLRVKCGECHKELLVFWLFPVTGGNNKFLAWLEGS